MTTLKKVMKTIIMTIGFITCEYILWLISELLYIVISGAIFTIGQVSNNWVLWFDHKHIVFTLIPFVVINGALWLLMTKDE